MPHVCNQYRVIRTHRTAPTDDMIATSSVDRIVDSAVVGFESSIKKNEMRFSVGPEFFNWEILNWVSLNIYHANIMRIIIIFKTVVPL